MTGPAATRSAVPDSAPDSMVEGGEARVIAERARACSGVAGLSGGPFGTVATYLPGRRLTGVSADEHAVQIAIVATLARPLPETAEEVRRAVADLAGGRSVHVRIDDVVSDPADTATDTAASNTVDDPREGS